MLIGILLALPIVSAAACVQIRWLRLEQRKADLFAEASRDRR